MAVAVDRTVPDFSRFHDRGHAHILINTFPAHPVFIRGKNVTFFID
jgi:hypothetical protein